MSIENERPGEISQPLILAIETATRSGSVAVTRGEQVLSARVGDASISHSTNLIEMIDAVLNEAKAELSDVDLFAVAVGPGSFTGLRIGLATVKAFAAVTSHAIVGVSTLAAIAHAAEVEGLVVSLLPAGRGEVFAQSFSVRERQVIALDEASHLSPAETWERYGQMQELHWAGEGVQKLADFREAISPETALSGRMLAESVAALALKDFREGKSVTADELQAIYVRASDAEINEKWRLQNEQQSAQV